jgi:hypothetical protein
MMVPAAAVPRIGLLESIEDPPVAATRPLKIPSFLIRTAGYEST